MTAKQKRELIELLLDLRAAPLASERGSSWKYCCNR